MKKLTRRTNLTALTRLAAVAFALLLALALLPTPTARADGPVVSNATQGDLQDAIDNVGDYGIITFAGVTSIELTGALVVPDGISITIDGGAGGVTLTLSGYGYRHITATGADATLTLKNLKLQGNGIGGGVQTTGSVVLENCTVSGNEATSLGGGVWAGNTATLTNCTVSDNSARYDGGGVYAYGTATLTNCTVSNNWAFGDGGGVYARNNATLTNCTVSGNEANDGGGVYARNTATLTNCTVSGNEANDGGGVFAYNNATLTNCTVSGNTANRGGGVFAGNNATLRGTIVAGNTNGGQVYVDLAGFTPLTVGVAESTTDPRLTGSYYIIDNDATAWLTDPDTGLYTPQSGLIAQIPATAYANWGVDTDIRGLTRTGGARTIGALEANVVVTVGGDADEIGNLRSAVNAAFDGSTITFDAALQDADAPIELTDALFVPTNISITIDGGAGVTLTLAGADYRHITADGGTLTLKNLKLQGNGVGGGVETEGSVVLENCTVSDNTAPNGGGVYAYNTATLTNCTVTDNEARYGGGVYAYGTATLTNCTVSGNSALNGGGVFAIGTATLTNCTVSGNSATYDGGGVYASSATLRGTIVAGNTNGGQVSVGGLGEVPTTGGVAESTTTDAFNGSYYIIADVATAWLGTVDLDTGLYTPQSGLIAKIPATAYADWGVDTDIRGFARTGGARTIGALEANVVVTVGGDADDEIGNLRSAVNAAFDGTVITFDAALQDASNPIQLTDALVVPTDKSITIDGGAGVTLTLEDGNNARHITATGANATLTLKNLTLKGKADGDTATIGFGGGVAVEGSVVLENCEVTGNEAADGGGVYAYNTATLTNCTVSGNEADYGGGVYAETTATLTNCTVSGNAAGDYGGGVYAETTATLTNCTVSGNAATNGGGVAATTATLTNCTVSGNAAGEYGGGVYAEDSATLTNCTVSGNSADNEDGGGGVDARNATLLATVVAGNTGNDVVLYDGTAYVPHTTNGEVWEDHRGIAPLAGSQYFIIGAPSGGIGEIFALKDGAIQFEIAEVDGVKFGSVPLASPGVAVNAIPLDAWTAMVAGLSPEQQSALALAMNVDSAGNRVARGTVTGHENIDIGSFEFVPLGGGTPPRRPIYDDPQPQPTPTIDKNAASPQRDDDGNHDDLTITITDKGNTVDGITNDGKPLEKGRDYDVDGDKVIIKGEYLDTLSAGRHTLVFDMARGENQRLTLTISANNSAPDAENPDADAPENAFADVSPTAWYAADVAWVAERGLMRGTSPTEFSPNGKMTRAMVFTVLARLAGIDTEGGENWYAIALEWGIEIGLTDGSNPTGNVTREQLVTLLWRYAGSPKVAATLDFADANAVAGWASDAMAWAVSVGIIRGNDNGTLNPQGDATRAEVAAMLRRFVEAVE